MLSIKFSCSILVLCIIHCGCLLSIFIASEIKIYTWLLIGPNCRPCGLDYAKRSPMLWIECLSNTSRELVRLKNN